MQDTTDLPFLLSYCFRDESGRIIESRYPAVPLTPASNMKLLTGISALLTLGKPHRFELFCNVSKDRLVFSGGPTFGLGTADIETVGDVIMGNGFDPQGPGRVSFLPGALDSNYYFLDWQIGDLGEPYQSPISNYSIDENCVRKGENADPIDSVDLHTNEKRYRSIQDPIAHFVSTLGKSLGVSFEYDPNADNGGKLLKIHQEALGSIITHMETYSCNFSAEVLFKYMGGRVGNGSWENGSSVVTEAIREYIGHEPAIKVRDGSGLSRSNMLSTAFLSELINKIASSRQKSFLESLAQPGTGTLRSRLSRYASEGIRAKTGTLSNVYTLTGYLTKRRVSFSIMLNNFPGNEYSGRSTVDLVLSSFLDENEVRTDLSRATN